MRGDGAVFRLRLPSEAELLRIASEHGASNDLTYPEVGATLRGERPAGYEHDESAIDLGAGPDVWARAVAALDVWAAHRGAGLRVGASGPPRTGDAVGVGAPLPGGVGCAVAVCRVVGTVDEEDRRGFAYGTLPLHPERGEEAFLLERSGDLVGFRVVAFSRRRHWMARAGAPVTKAVQRATLRRYLAGLSAAVR